MPGLQPTLTYGDRLSDGKLQTHAHWSQKSHGEALDRPIWRDYETCPGAISCFLLACNVPLVAHEPRSHPICFPKTPDGGYRRKASVSRGRQMRRSCHVHAGVWACVGGLGARLAALCLLSWAGRGNEGGQLISTDITQSLDSRSRPREGTQSLVKVCCRPHRAVWRATPRRSR